MKQILIHKYNFITMYYRTECVKQIDRLYQLFFKIIIFNFMNTPDIHCNKNI